ncbi:MAG: peptidylprolyl isomerase [Succinivibrionaceae bacterium]
MKITANTVVTIDFIVTDENGQVLDTTNGAEPMEVLIGHSNIVPGLEDALLGKEDGDRVEVTVAPDRAYGERHEDLVQTIDKSMFDGMELNVGDSFLADTDLGSKTIVVKEILDDSVVVDGNHPLAGLTLKFMVDVISVRDATDSEVEHGHVHGAHGCCHGHHHDGEDGHCCCHGHHHDDDKCHCHDEGNECQCHENHQDK